MKSEFERARHHLEKAREIIANRKLAEGDVTVLECCTALDLLIEAMLAMEYARASEPPGVVPFRKKAAKITGR